MTKYTEKEMKAVRPRIYSLMTTNGAWQVKAYLKENAIAYFRAKSKDEFEDSDVYVTNAINSHQSPVDEPVRADWYHEGDEIIEEFEFRLQS